MRISEFFRDKVVFITGATGFLGQPLVEKILFASPSVRRIYVLIRPKAQMRSRSNSAQDRLERELYGSSVFDRLRGIYGEGLEEFLREKLVAVSGDISQEGLGIAPELQEQLHQKVDLVINSAAVVSFDAPLDQALELNVLAAKRITEFARSCPNAIFVHVSTAYVAGATRKIAEESLYHRASEAPEMFPNGRIKDFNLDIARIREIVQEVKDTAESSAVTEELTRLMEKQGRRKKKKSNRSPGEKLARLRRTWLHTKLTQRGMAWARERGWNDTYTYTKALGEQIVNHHRGEMPTVIMRPSVIESSLTEPSPGWLDGLRMADPLIVAIGKGRLKSLPLNPDVALDLVPVDVVVNAILAAVPKIAASGGLEVYQVATSSQNPIHLGELYELIHAYFKKHPMLDRQGHPIQLRRLRFPNPATFRIQHKLKSVPLDTAERTLSRFAIFESTQRVKRRIAKARTAHERLYYYGEIYEPYLNLNCRFMVDRTIELYRSLDPEEQKRFNFDVTRVNWRHYIQNVHIPGVKKYILKLEGAGTMELDRTTALPVETIRELLDHSARRYGSQVALQMKRGEDWERYSYSELKSGARKVGERLHQLGLRKGDRVVLYSENQPKWGIAYLGAVELGVVLVPIDSQTWTREAWSLAAFTGAKAILASERCFSRLQEKELEENEKSENPVVLLSVDSFCQPFKDERYPRSTNPAPTAAKMERAELAPDDIASVIFTTGTAEDPKGAVHTHRNFLNNLAGVNQFLPVQPHDSILSILPLYHALEFSCGFLMALMGGATVTYTSSLKPRLIFELMRETGTTCMLGVPTFYALLREDIERRVLKTGKSAFQSNLTATSKQLSRSVERRFGRNIGKQIFARVHQEFGGKIRFLVSGGSALGKDLYEHFKVLGVTIYEGYGLTETAPVLTVNPQFLSRAGSAGKPLPGVEVRLDHPDSEGVGEIVVRSPSIMLEYLNNPSATSRAIRDGWFYTGDLGWVDVDGYIYITGRIKDVIVTGAGKNVYPSDVESAYRSLDAVEDLVVFGVRSGLTEEVHAIVEPAEDLQEDTPDEKKATIQKAIRSLARELPSYHRLQQVHISDGALARTDSGCVDRESVINALRPSLVPKKHAKQGLTKDGSRPTEKTQLLLAELSRLSGVPASEMSRETDIYVDLGLDSLMAIELLLFAEAEFHIQIPDTRAARIHTVGELFDELAKDEPDKKGRVSDPKKLVSSALPYEERPLVDRLLFSFSLRGLLVLFRSLFSLSSQASNIPQGQPYIIAANHSSHLDTAAILSALTQSVGRDEARRLHVLGARDYFFRSPVRGWFVSRLLNVVPIERKENSLGSLRLVKRILASGEPVLIYPEGTRSRTGVMQEFKPGLGLMAWEAGVPVIPAYIDGAYNALPAGKSMPSMRPVKVTFGAPLAMASYSNNGGRVNRDEVYRQIASDVRESIVEMRTEQSGS